MSDEVKKVPVKEVVKKEATTKKSDAECILSDGVVVPIQEHKICGKTVYIHGFTSLERGQWLTGIKKPGSSNNILGTIDSGISEPLMFQMCVRDKNGDRLFARSDIPKIKMLAAKIVTGVVEICYRLSGVGEAADEDIVKN